MPRPIILTPQPTKATAPAKKSRARTTTPRIAAIAGAPLATAVNTPAITDKTTTNAATAPTAFHKASHFTSVRKDKP